MQITDRAGVPDSVQAVCAWLEDRDVAHKVIRHQTAASAGEEADVLGRPREMVAKTVVLDWEGGHSLAVVPACERVSLPKLRDVLGADRHLVLAAEDELVRDLPDFELGAIPPLGPLVEAPEIVDPRLLVYGHVMCAAGDRCHSLVLDPEDMVRVTGAQVADICED
jgi:prolyl-tRNA editing enzyme YbaK/EbsC (Cys-tRNA(Pro) deacylase)